MYYYYYWYCVKIAKKCMKLPSTSDTRLNRTVISLRKVAYNKAAKFLP